MPSFLSNAGICSLASSVRHPAGTTHVRCGDLALKTVLNSTCTTGPFAAEGYASATMAWPNPDSSVIETVKDKRVLTDGNMVLETHLMRGQLHTEGLLMVYVPKEKMLIQADAYIPRPGAPPLPTPSPHTINLVDNVSRLKLNVERVVHIHGGSSPYTDLLTAAGRPQAANQGH